MFLQKQLRDYRTSVRHRYLKQIDRLEPLSDQDLAENAIIFSPHQDDETLGCGGTIIRKHEAGAKIKIVFMTDGSRSHHRFIPEDELIMLRQQEAIKAAQILGVAKKT